MRLGPKLGEGLSAEVFEWDDNCDEPPKVLKLFNEGRSRQSVERELQFSRAAVEAGVSTPMMYGEVVEWDGRIGIVYERVVEQSWMRLLYILFRTKSYSQMLADLHFKMHANLY